MSRPLQPSTTSSTLRALPVIGQAEMACCSMQQPYAEMLFDLSDLPADG
jgi:hypothetical protein